LLTEIVTDEQLIKLYTTPGYLVAVDYSKEEVKLHTIDCMLADPISTIGVKPSMFDIGGFQIFQCQTRLPS